MNFDRKTAGILSGGGMLLGLLAVYLTALRADQKRKRNLMRLLDQHGL
ncbi:hypothetical protein ACFV1F_06645 [Streptomyces sp. NPDC059590]